MLEGLHELLKKKYDYILDDYALFKIPRTKNKVFRVTALLFLVVLVLYILGVAGVMTELISIPVLLFLAVVLLLVPLALKKTGGKFDSIIVTPKFLIQRTGKKEYTVIDFDEITGFKINSDGINIKSKGHTVILSVNMFREEIDPIMDILEAKGKTFEADKEDLIRPIQIIIKNNEISIKELEVMLEEEDELYAKYVEHYEMLTPGFLNEIIFRNSNVNDCDCDGEILAIKLDQIIVKDGHPENTKFDAITATDCILVFEGLTIKSLILQDLNNPDVADQKLDPEVGLLPEYLENAVISHWKTAKNKGDFYFATGVHILKTSFTFERVLVGWKDFK